jgi:hypothetical protein
MIASCTDGTSFAEGLDGVPSQLGSMNPTDDIVCREIGVEDLQAVSTLLAHGFCWSQAHWMAGLQRMRERSAPVGLPRFGYMLDRGGEALGVLLTLFAPAPGGDGRIRCNVSSWYVRPDARGHGGRMVERVLQHRGVTILDLSPLPNTHRFLRRLGLRPYTEGQYVAAAALGIGGSGVRVRAYRPEDENRLVDPDVSRLLDDHARFGCVCLLGDTGDGAPEPFVFALRPLPRTPLRYAQLIYCNDTEAFVRCAGALGRWLLLHRRVAVVTVTSRPATTTSPIRRLWFSRCERPILARP